MIWYEKSLSFWGTYVPQTPSLLLCPPPNNPVRSTPLSVDYVKQSSHIQTRHAQFMAHEKRSNVFHFHVTVTLSPSTRTWSKLRRTMKSDQWSCDDSCQVEPRASLCLDMHVMAATRWTDSVPPVIVSLAKTRFSWNLALSDVICCCSRRRVS